MPDYLYFDSAATAKPSECALRAAQAAFAEFGNPSSLHGAGLAAKRLVDTARGQVARAMRCDSAQITFVSSGTEANNQVLFGLAKARAKRANKIISTDSEHPSVEEPLKALESQGFSVVRLRTKNGMLDTEQLKNELQSPVAFLSIMQANNETGAVYDLAEVRRILTESGSDAPLHCDAVQGFCKAEYDKLISVCDLVTVSAHKIGGIKGAGALYIGKNIRNLPAYLLGGGQENGMRSGTENVPAIAAFGAAAEDVLQNKDRLPYLASLREQVIKNLQDSGIILHIPEHHLPNILHISIPGVLSSWALNLLSAKNICVSAGSACSAREKKKGNRVLSAYGLPPKEIETSLRLSFDVHNTREECALLCDALKQCVGLKR
ncbi:MAG: cysteine desulfurase [Clostridia bacterium]|nr:cysteine desulfurase [Clostridia bacterium]